jgi:hypothetical protein
MSRRAYYLIAMSQSVEWLIQCAANPSAHMRARHVVLIRLAIRNKI